MAVILQTVAASRGYAKDFSLVDPSKIVGTRIISSTAGFFMILAAAWSKISFALTLLRITDGWTKRIVWAVIVTVSAVLFVSVLIQWFWCWPSYRIWDHNSPGRCLPRQVINGYNMAASGIAQLSLSSLRGLEAHSLSHPGYSAAMDILLALLPWKIVSSLTMTGKARFGVAFAMSLGVL